MNKETYIKFEDFAKRCSESKNISEIYYLPITRLEWIEKAMPNSETVKVPQLLASVRLTAMDISPANQRHLSFTEFIINEVLENEEQGRAAQEKITAAVKTAIEKLQDKCPKCRLFEGSVET